MKTVILDTNAALLPFEAQVDVMHEVFTLLGEVHYVMPTAMMDELRGFTNAKDTRARNARMAIKYWSERAELVKQSLPGDDALLQFLREAKEPVWLLTNDRKLKLEAIKAGAGLLQPRGHRRLEEASAPRLGSNGSA